MENAKVSCANVQETEKESVYENENTALAAQGVTTQTETGAAAQSGFGKFRDSASLLKAYSSLEAEFTRRSQRIKELEGALSKQTAQVKEGRIKLSENPVLPQNNEAAAFNRPQGSEGRKNLEKNEDVLIDLLKDDSLKSSRSNLPVGEKENFQSRENPINLLSAQENAPTIQEQADKSAGGAVAGDEAEDTEAFRQEKDIEVFCKLTDSELEVETEKFLKKYPGASAMAEEIARQAAKGNDYSEGFLERAYVSSLQNELSSKSSVLNDRQKLKNYVFSNNALKDEIIKEYLNGIKRGERVTLLSEVGLGITMPPKKPSSILEAGILAREMLQKK